MYIPKEIRYTIFSYLSFDELDKKKLFTDGLFHFLNIYNLQKGHH